MKINFNYNSVSDTVNQRKSVFGGNIFKNGKDMSMSEQIEQKRQLAMKQARRVVGDAYKGEKSIDDAIKEQQDLIEEHKLRMQENNELVQECDKRLEQAKEDFCVDEDGEEQKNLELMYKQIKAQRGGEQLTKEERKQLAAAGEMTDYQQYALDVYKQRDYYEQEIDKSKRYITGISAGVRQMKIDRLESHAMADANRAKEEILENASKEMMSMLVEESKDNIQNQFEETIEAAEERKEKEEIKEEQIEAVKEDRTKAEAAAEEIREDAERMTKGIIGTEMVQTDIQTEIDQFLEEEKMLIEELKGMVINENI